MANSFKELIVWQKSVDLVEVIYIETSSLPAKESFGLQSQMRRAAVSIPSNIAEGAKRRTSKDFLHFLHMSDGSAAELETQVTIAERVYPRITFEQSRLLLVEVQKMLAAMVFRIHSKARSRKH